jgi:hypothetical protein
LIQPDKIPIFRKKLATIDNIRNSLIDKILAIRNEKFLAALDSLISSSKNENENIELTEEQKIMLQMSEEDISKGDVISHQELKSKTAGWLKSKAI